jgi:hypothetical protein
MIGVLAELNFAISGAVGGCQVSDVLGGAVRAQAMLMWKEDDLSSVGEGEFDGDCVGSLLCAGVPGSGAAAEAYRGGWPCDWTVSLHTLSSLFKLSSRGFATRSARNQRVPS